MKVEVTKQFKTGKGILNKGTILNVKPETARKWHDDGLVKIRGI